MSRKKTTMVFLSSHVITFILNFIFLILISRWLSPANFVAFSVLIALLNLLVQISTLGQVPFIIRNFNNHSYRDFDLGWVSRSSLGVGFILAALALGVAILLGRVDLDPLLLSILILAVILTAISNISAAIFRGARSSWSYLVVCAGQKFILIGLLVLALNFSFASPQALTVLVAIIVSTLVVLLLTGFKYAPESEHHKARGLKVLQSGLAFLIPISAMNFLILLIPFIERSFLAGRFPDIEVASYIFNFELAARLSAGLLILMKVVVWPEVASGVPEVERRRYKKVLRAVLAASAGAIGLAFLLAPTFYLPVGTALGMNPDYLTADLLIIAIAFAVMTVINYTILMGIMLTGRTWLSLLGAVIFVSLYALLLLPLTIMFGLFGAAAALLSSQVFNGVVLYYGNRRAIREHC